ncbi:MAG: 4-(cytidine 5'-diphospho)-2-C-methyl-D-erythritol kinase [Aestuariibacter sp.]
MKDTYFNWPSPAKLNLFLHILGKRADGYHELQSLFQILDFGDEISLRIRQDNQINLLTDFNGVPSQENLIVKAAKLLKSASNSRLGCDIKVNKRLPMGGGIGGGSSNAATTLVALNAMWRCGKSQSELMELGLILGADVPVFVHGKTAFATGVGEQLQAHFLPEKSFLVVNPGVHVSTAEMFKHPELPRNTPKINWQDYHFETTSNDFQKLACQLFPDIANSLHWLLQYAPSRMTGTGACLFGVFDDSEAAEQVLAKLPANMTGFIASGCNQSPLLTCLDDFQQLALTNTTKHT